MTETIPVTVVIPVHPARENNGMLRRVLASIDRQTVQPQEIIVQYDHNKQGAAKTRHEGLMSVETEWVTFIDSDDEMRPEHLETLYDGAIQNEADLVYSWYTVVGGNDPMAVHFGKPWNPEKPRLVTIVTFCKTDIAQKVGFVHDHDGTILNRQPAGEDWFFINGVNKLGSKIVHIPKRTWIWNHHGKNTSGLPTKGDAR